MFDDDDWHNGDNVPEAILVADGHSWEEYCIVIQDLGVDVYRSLLIKQEAQERLVHKQCEAD